MCFDAAEILDEVGAVCNSTGWQLEGILSHKPVSSGKSFSFSLFRGNVIYKCLTVLIAGSGVYYNFLFI